MQTSHFQKVIKKEKRKLARVGDAVLKVPRDRAQRERHSQATITVEVPTNFIPP
jgi:hypothetical protein